ncbi:hypothetical protein D5S17_36025 [Pseudonocardiaceae bacterium YIM PH 21723]|nr:hypothetical protein D5S17_36025 [Pseudonocardiaceae bacterium YIM PH 21723]
MATISRNRHTGHLRSRLDELPGRAHAAVDSLLAGLRPSWSTQRPVEPELEVCADAQRLSDELTKELHVPVIITFDGVSGTWTARYRGDDSTRKALESLLACCTPPSLPRPQLDIEALRLCRFVPGGDQS